MTTQQVADRYYELAQTGQNEQIINELYSPDIVSIEPENDSNVPLRVEGTKAYKEKEKIFFELVDEFHSGFCKAPIVSTFHFACAMGMDVTIKGSRKLKEEIGVFEVRDGKIVAEQFFYDDFH
ncbi:MAG: nuclear transport factor 2 family protein [Flavobacterium sp.]|uniref:SnoaL-like domain-containing protein n=1 Tax=Flavobacterium sp. TaxID=239 RepID=UPI0011F6FB5F|nr:SnoaL-like domain-containing protein [Flavobacterium sp.]RZJ67802.1 MAG: nuclear transport factor 2 family protein [Flavobacterium sp.]